MDIETLRAFCSSLPATTEDVKWGNDLCFSIGGKMYCVTSLSGELKVSLKADAEEFDELCSRKGIIPAPYMARHKWILIDCRSFNDKEWRHYIRQSYELVKEKLPQNVKKQLLGK